MASSELRGRADIVNGMATSLYWTTARMRAGVGMHRAGVSGWSRRMAADSLVLLAMYGIVRIHVEKRPLQPSQCSPKAQRFQSPDAKWEEVVLIGYSPFSWSLYRVYCSNMSVHIGYR